MLALITTAVDLIARVPNGDPHAPLRVPAVAVARGTGTRDALRVRVVDRGEGPVVERVHQSARVEVDDSATAPAPDLLEAHGLHRRLAGDGLALTQDGRAA